MPVLLVILSMISLVSGASLAKTLFESLGPETTTVLRLAVSTGFMFLFWRPWQNQISKNQLKSIAIYGASVGAMNLAFYLAIARLPIGLAIAIEFLGPLSVAIYYSKRILDFLWIVLASVGILLILPLTEIQQKVDIIGVSYALFAAACWALYIVQGKKTSAVAPPSLTAPIGMFIGFLVTLPFGLQNIQNAVSDVNLIYLAIAVGLLSSAIPYSLELIALPKLSSKHFSLLLSLEPVIGGIIGWIILKESLTSLQIAAMICIIAASVGSTLN